MHVWVLPRLHTHKTWAKVPFSAHLLHNGLSISSIMYRCLLRVLCQLRRPVTNLDCILLKDSSLVLVVRLGPQDQFLSLCLSTGKTLPHCHMLVVNLAFYLSYCNLPRELQGTFQSNKLVNSSLPFKPIGSFISIRPRMSEDPKRVLRNGGWKCCSPSGTIALMGTLFWQPEELSKLPITKILMYFSGVSFEFCKLRPR